MNKKYFPEVIKLGYPLLAGMFAEYIMYIADSIMVGRLGTGYLAAVAVGGLVVEILWVFAWTLAPAVQTICSRRFGTQDEGTASFTGKVFDTGIIFGLLAGVLTLLTSFLAETVLSALIHTQATVDLSMEYIRIIRWSIPISALFYVIYGFLAGIKKTKQVMYATIGTNLLNVFINYILIFGKFGSPARGIRGAAWGTLVAQAAGLIYFAALVLLSKELKPYKLFQFKGLTKNLFIDTGRAWIPLCLQYIFSHTIFLVYEGLISRFGAVYLAAIHIILSVFWFGKTIVGGFAEGASILVGNSLGRKEKREAVRYTYSSIGLGTIIGVILFVLCMFFPELLVKIFNSEADTVAAGSAALRYFAAFILVGSIGHSIEMVFTHNGWGNFVFIADFSSNLILTLGFTTLVMNVFNGGIKAAWTGYALYIIVFSLVLTAGFFSMRWTMRVVDRDSADL